MTDKEIEIKIQNIIEGVKSEGARKNPNYVEISEDFKKILKEFNKFRIRFNKSDVLRRKILIGKIRKIFAEEIKNTNIEKLTEVDTENWIDYCVNDNEEENRKKMALNTIKQRFFDYKHFLTWYFKHYKKYKNYSERVEKLTDILKEANTKADTTKNHGGDKIKRTNWEDVKKIAQLGTNMYQAMITTQFNSGYRPGEHESLNICDIDVIETEEHGKIFYFNPRRKLKDNENLRKSIPLNLSQKYLVAWLSIHPKMSLEDIDNLKQGDLPLKDNKNPLWCTSTGKRIKHVTYFTMLKRLVKRAELDYNLTPHVLRHGYALWRKMKGDSIEKLMVQLGHKDIGTTVNVYGQIEMDDILNSKKAKSKNDIDRENDSNNKTLQHCNNCIQDYPSWFNICPKCNRALSEEGNKLINEKEEMMRSEIKSILAQEFESRQTEVKDDILTGMNDEINRLKKMVEELKSQKA